MRFSDFQQSELDALWDELEEAEDRLESIRSKLPEEGEVPVEVLREHQEALSEVIRLRYAYYNFGG